MNKFILIPVFFSWFFSFGQDYGTGLIKDKKAYAKITLADRPLGYGDGLPSRINLKNYLPPIVNQGSENTSVAWASTYYVATMEYAILQGITNQNEIRANAFDPYYTYMSCTNNNDYFDCSDGLSMTEPAQWMVENDLKRFAYNKLECGYRISKRNKPSNSLLDITSCYRLIDESSTQEENLTAMKRALSNKHPLFVGIDIYSDFYDITSDGLYTSLTGVDLYGWHAMAMIGYDDDLYGGCFILANSWGENWGNGGLLYVKYDDFFELDPLALYFETSLRSRGTGSGCVYGDCEDGFGRYVYSNGDVYEGDFTEGKRGGYGFYLWTSKEHFGGEWMSDNRHGSGYYMAPGTLTEGYWKDGVYNGWDLVENTLVNDDRVEKPEDLYVIYNETEAYELLAKDGNLDRVENLNVTECVYGDCEDGFGIYQSGTTWIYAGQWKDGNRQGYGELYWLGLERGHVYEGQFVQGYREGNGTYYFPSGDIYYGEWLEGDRHGQGAMFYYDGSVSAGEWVDGVIQDDSMGFGKKDKTPLKDVNVAVSKEVQNPPLAQKPPVKPTKKKKK